MHGLWLGFLGALLGMIAVLNGIFPLLLLSAVGMGIARSGSQMSRFVVGEMFPVDKRARELMDLVDLSARTGHKPMQLSGGEQQRVAIAVALANAPKLLLADEPTGELDSATSDQVYELFKRLNRELGLTICIVSHDPLVAQHVGRVVAIRDGKLASETVRRQFKRKGSPQAAESWEEQFEELIVLDSAGRLQIPKQYRDELGFENRVEMEVQAGGLFIRPARNLEQTSSQSEIQLERAIPEENGRRGRLLARLRGRGS